MYTEKENDLFKQSRAIIDLHGFFVITEDDFVLDNPKIIVNLLTIKEAIAFDSFDEKDATDRLDIEEAIVQNNILSIVNYKDQTISILRTPAGVISLIAEAIIKCTQSYLEQPVLKYQEIELNVTFLDTMASIISYYMNTPIDTVLQWPVSQIYKRYAMCAKAFPSQVTPLTSGEEEEQ